MLGVDELQLLLHLMANQGRVGGLKGRLRSESESLQLLAVCSAVSRSWWEAANREMGAWLVQMHDRTAAGRESPFPYPYPGRAMPLSVRMRDDLRNNLGDRSGVALLRVLNQFLRHARERQDLR